MTTQAKFRSRSRGLARVRSHTELGRLRCCSIVAVAAGRRVGDAAAEHAAVGQHHFLESANRLAATSGLEGDGELVAGVDDVAGPAGTHQAAGTRGFDAPVGDAAFGVFHIEINLDVGIREREFSNRADHGDGMVGVIFGVGTVVRHHGPGNQ